MSPHLLILGFGYTAHFLAQKMRGTPMRVTGTTRHESALGYDDILDCEVVHFSENSIEQALKTTTHLLISTPPIAHLGDPVLAELRHLLKQYCTNIQWVGYLSSTSVYGDHQGQWVDETSSAIAIGEQGRLRLAAEHAWTAFAETHQLPCTIFRLAGIYGPERNILARLRAGKKETIVKPGQFFSRIHVEDIVTAILASIAHPTQGTHIYNVADDEPAPNDVVDDYAAALLQLPPLIHIPYEQANLSPMAQEFYLHNKKVSNAKLKKELHLQLAYPTYKEGLLHLRSELCQ